MNQKIVKYLDAINMGSKLISKVRSLHNNFISIYGETILDAVVSEYINEDGQRQYASVYFFSEHHIYEATNFLTDECKIWIARLTGNVGSVGFTSKEFDFKIPTPSSRLSLDVRWAHGSDFFIDIQASGDNCSHLLEITRSYFNKNIA